MPVFKNYNEKVDIISCQVLNKNDKNWGFDRWTENRQNTRSGNVAFMPQDMNVTCPITGRNIVRR